MQKKQQKSYFFKVFVMIRFNLKGLIERWSIQHKKTETFLLYETAYAIMTKMLIISFDEAPLPWQRFYNH